MLDPSTIRPLNRRQVVQGAGAAAAMAALTQSAQAQATSAPPAPDFGTASTLPTERQLLLSLYERASFGFDGTGFARLAALGHEAWLDEQLDPDSIDDTGLAARLAPFDWIGMSAAEMEDHPSKEVWDIAHESRGVRMLRAVFSQRQLFERVVEFWTDHFNIYGSADDTWVLKIVDDRDVIRQHALGNFSDLLRASAASPAMLTFLDNDTNTVGAPQENYAREVMELHTLGADGPYTENDVREVARCFTSWGFVKWWENGEYGTFVYRPNDHDNGAKTVLGMQIAPGGGINDGYDVLDLLASHPKTIDYVTRKLARWFLGYAPPERAIGRAKRRWSATGGDMKEVIKSLLSPTSFSYAAPWDNKKLKRPFHWITSLFRATGMDIPEPTSSIWHIWGIGQVPFQWPAPNGYPDSAPAWASTLMQRWQQASNFCNGWYWSTGHTINDIRPLLQGAPKSEWVQRINLLFKGGAMDAYEVSRIQAYIDTFQNEGDQAVGEAFELCASSPSFQAY